MRKYNSVLILVVFLLVSSFFITSKVEHANADVPTPQDCPEGSQRLTFADGSNADANIGSANVFNNQQNIDPGVVQGVQKWEKANNWKRCMILDTCGNNAIPFLPKIEKAFAFDMSTAAGLAEVVKQEGGGGPFCYNPQTGGIYEALSNQNCAQRFPGTQFAGFKVADLQPTYMCGVPSPWTDG